MTRQERIEQIQDQLRKANEEYQTLLRAQRQYEDMRVALNAQLLLLQDLEREETAGETAETAVAESGKKKK